MGVIKSEIHTELRPIGKCQIRPAPDRNLPPGLEFHPEWPVRCHRQNRRSHGIVRQGKPARERNLQPSLGADVQHPVRIQAGGPRQRETGVPHRYPPAPDPGLLKYPALQCQREFLEQHHIQPAVGRQSKQGNHHRHAQRCQAQLVLRAARKSEIGRQLKRGIGSEACHHGTKLQNRRAIAHHPRTLGEPQQEPLPSPGWIPAPGTVFKRPHPTIRCHTHPCTLHRQPIGAKHNKMIRISQQGSGRRAGLQPHPVESPVGRAKIIVIKHRPGRRQGCQRHPVGAVQTVVCRTLQFIRRPRHTRPPHPPRPVRQFRRIQQPDSFRTGGREDHEQDQKGGSNHHGNSRRLHADKSIVKFDVKFVNR